MWWNCCWKGTGSMYTLTLYDKKGKRTQTVQENSPARCLLQLAVQCELKDHDLKFHYAECVNDLGALQWTLHVGDK